MTSELIGSEPIDDDLICVLIMTVTSTAHAAEFSGSVDP